MSGMTVALQVWSVTTLRCYVMRGHTLDDADTSATAQ